MERGVGVCGTWVGVRDVCCGAAGDSRDADAPAAPSDHAGCSGSCQGESQGQGTLTGCSGPEERREEALRHSARSSVVFHVLMPLICSVFALPSVLSASVSNRLHHGMLSLWHGIGHCVCWLLAWVLHPHRRTAPARAAVANGEGTQGDAQCLLACHWCFAS